MELDRASTSFLCRLDQHVGSPTSQKCRLVYVKLRRLATQLLKILQPFTDDNLVGFDLLIGKLDGDI